MRLTAKRRADWLMSESFYEGRQRQVRVGGTRFEVVEVGRGEPIVLVPGLAGGWRLLTPLARALARHHRVILVQLSRRVRCPLGPSGAGGRRPRSRPGGAGRRAGPGTADHLRRLVRRGGRAGVRGRAADADRASGPVGGRGASSGRRSARRSPGGSWSGSRSRRTTRSSTSSSTSSTPGARRGADVAVRGRAVLGDRSGGDGPPPGDARIVRRDRPVVAARGADAGPGRDSRRGRPRRPARRLSPRRSRGRHFESIGDAGHVGFLTHSAEAARQVERLCRGEWPSLA